LASANAEFRRSERQNLSLVGENTRLSTRTERKKSKKCFWRTEFLIKQSKEYEEGKRGLTECYEKTKSKSKNICVRGERWRKRLLQACSKTKPMFTILLSEKVKEFNGVIRNHKDKTEKRLWEFGKRLNFNESI